METITCYRPAGKKELDIVLESGYSKWPPRLPEQLIFYPVTNEEYAFELTKWNVTDFGARYVTKFSVSKEFMSKYPIKCVGAKHHTEWWVPAEDLEELNRNICGKIEVVGEYDNS
ncbi:MAG: hypothetical protein KUG78_14695 [Kangiellaceae bacterium]|nr:hypothetical protein [Kangiellaceae bacterium]